MAHRGIKAKREAEHRRAMRREGYAAGVAGRPAVWSDAVYQDAWRQGRHVRALMLGGGQ